MAEVDGIAFILITTGKLAVEPHDGLPLSVAVILKLVVDEMEGGA